MKFKEMARVLAIALTVTLAALGPARAQSIVTLHNINVDPVALAIELNTNLLNIKVQLAAAQAADDRAQVTYLQAEAATLQLLATQSLSSIGTLLSASSSMLSSASASLAALNASLSCPVFDGDGTGLREDSCAWTKLTGQRTSQFGNVSDGIGLRVGGQKEIADGWLVGGTLHGDTSWMAQTAGGVSNTGQAYDGSLVLKRMIGAWLFAGALTLGTSSTHTSRPAASGGLMQDDATVFSGGARLRASYDFPFAGWYARPRLDVDGYYAHQAPLQEYGPDVTGFAVSGSDKVSMSIAPALEIGGRFAAGSTILRPYLVAGAIFLPDNVWTMDVGFTGQAARFGVFQMEFDGPTALAVLEAGLQVYREHGLEVKAEYGLTTGNDYLSQSVSLRGAYHF